MSFQITEHFVKEFSSNIYILAQQKGSKLRPFVRYESIKGKSKAFDRLGAVEARDKTTRHENTPQIDTPHSRRWCFLADKDWGDMIDDLDKVRLLNDPQSEYMMLGMWALGRKIDDVIIKAFGATVITGEEADGTAVLPNSQKYAANDGTNLTNLNVKTLIAVKSKFGVNDIDPELQVHMAFTQRQLDALLGDDQITSADYNTVKALVEGKVDTFMGIQFHRLERLTSQEGALAVDPTTGAVGSGGGDAAGSRKCYAWTQPAMILGVGQDMKGRIAERADKSFSTQVYACMAVGSVRMEEAAVVEVFCKES
jgi:hypothetical protein